jgi:hypothetical protein
MKRFTSMLFVLVITLVAVAPAYAAPPVTETFEYVDVYPFFNCNEFDRGFWIFNNEVGTIKLKSFYDKDGNLMKEAGHVSGIDHFYAEGYPDNVIVGNFVANWTTWVDPETGEWALEHNAGNAYLITLPGYGNVFHIAGMFDQQYNPSTDEWEFLKEAGIRYEDWELICEYLDPST